MAVEIDTTKPPGTQPKSPQATAASLGVWQSLQNQPLGQRNGENFNVPMNYVIPPARIYVINHSRTCSWKRVHIAVSSMHGAEEALIYDKELAQIYNVDTLYREVKAGRDMTRYKTGIQAIVFAFKCGGQTYAIPPARDEKSAPPRVEVREGSWDLFLGNYDRMRAVDTAGNPDPTTQGDERSKLALAWSARHNPVMCYTDDGVTTQLQNKYGFLEFVRETQKQITEPLDKEYLSALDILET
jgi:hypothetical protein